MAPSKTIGFFLGEEKVTLVDFEKNAPLHVFSAPLSSKSDSASPFSSILAQEIQITSVFKKLLDDNKFGNSVFYVSLPMKEIILRSFVIPFVKPEEIHNVIKFESNKYLPIDIKELYFVFHTIPFTENKIKRLQVIFFAVRLESLEKYDRIFKQVNASISYCEPCMVSLAKVLLFKKEIFPTERLAFLILDKNLGRICFIDQGIPQFIREFFINPPGLQEENKDTPESLNFRIVNEVGNSFDFYSRQFAGDPIEQMLVSAEEVNEDLINSLETEIRIKVRKIAPVVTMGPTGQSNDMDTIFAMGACVDPSIDSLAEFNFTKGKIAKPKVEGDVLYYLKNNKEIVFVFIMCVIALFAVYLFFQAQNKIAQHQYEQLSAKQGTDENIPIETIQDELKGNTDKLSTYKNIRIKSEMGSVVFTVASHLPKGASLKDFSVQYDQTNYNSSSMVINMAGTVTGIDPNQQIAVINKIFSDLKNDKDLQKFIKKVNLVSLNREDDEGSQTTGFSIHCN